MTTSIVLCNNLSFNTNHNQTPLRSRNLSTKSSSFLLQWSNRRRRFRGIFPKATKNGKNHSKRKRSWWRRFFLDEDGNWFGLKDDDMLDAEAEISENPSDGELSEEEKFEAWKRRAEAIVELREAQEDMLNEESRRWEDWIVDYGDNGHDDASNGSWWSQEFDGNGGIGIEDDLLYEDRVFRYASLNSAKFLAVIIIIPWALDFAVHDYVLMPFLDRYVKTVPLAAQMLDVRKSQKLEMVKELKVEKARLLLEVEIGKSPPLSDEEEWWELRHKAIELRDDWRLENRRSFANIWSDMVFGISVFILLYFNQSKVALLKFTGYKILNNVTDIGKAFLIILITDIFLGYHSESGWQTLLEVIVEHYGVEVDQSAITIFICLVPVVIDACVKLWLFKYLPRLSPRVSNIFREMKRH
ncbi:hypothetical protein OIU84_011277 [Salix udensis]|uniref:Chloroplast envelope membrane protein n=1 Tax=Salix udensis TaxID=889485 RepID=A0AAD6NX13_9ROSI|nr:hypothetical protein OIU84_011277 [Salix udensis]